MNWLVFCSCVEEEAIVFARAGPEDDPGVPFVFRRTGADPGLPFFSYPIGGGVPTVLYWTGVGLDPNSFDP